MGLEHRAEERFNPKQEESLDIYKWGDRFELVAGKDHCQIQNVSKHGLMVRSASPLTENQRFRLRFHLDGNVEMTLFGQVKWSVPHNDGHLAGLALEDTLGTDYLLWQNRLSRMLLDNIIFVANEKEPHRVPA